MNSRLRELINKVIPNRIKGDSLIHVEAGDSLDVDGFFTFLLVLRLSFRITLASI